MDDSSKILRSDNWIFMMQYSNFVRYFLSYNCISVLLISDLEAGDNKGLDDWYLHMIYLQLQIKFFCVQLSQNKIYKVRYIDHISQVTDGDFAHVSVSCVIPQYWLHCPVALLVVWAKIVSYSEQINHKTDNSSPRGFLPVVLSQPAFPSIST